MTRVRKRLAVGGRLDLVGERLARVVLPAGDDHVRTRLGERLDDLAAEAAATAGDECDSVLQGEAPKNGGQRDTWHGRQPRTPLSRATPIWSQSKPSSNRMSSVCCP